MTRAVKELLEADFKRQYAGLDSVLVVNVHHLDGVAANALRRELRKKQIELHVVKNRALKRILSGTKLEAVAPLLKGPCAFVTGGPGPVDTAKELIRLAKEYPALELKVGVVEGEPTAASIEDISRRRSKAELQAEIILLSLSPARRVAGCLRVGPRIAGCIKAVAQRLEKGEKITKVA